MVIRIFRHFVPVTVILLALCELTAISVVWYFLLGNSFSTDRAQGVIASPSLRLAILAGAAMVVTGLYHNKTLVDYKILVKHIFVGLIILCPIIIAGLLFWQNTSDSRGSVWDVYQKAALSWLLCILFSRAIFVILADLDLFKKRVIVLGVGNKAARIAADAASAENRYFKPVAFLRCGTDPEGTSFGAIEVSEEDPDAIVRHAQALKAREVVVAADDRRGLPVRQLLQCRLAGICVIEYLDFIERETKSVDLNVLHPGWFVFSDGFRGCGPRKIGKRCFDITLSLGLLLFTLPLLLIAWFLIVLDSRGPALYRQKRVGLGGETFLVLKFRSMRVDAEISGRAQWAGTNDPRVTRIGRIIRKLRVDELPQLFNVLRGDMSFVGPRPERPEFVDGFAKQIPFYAERHCVKPGITGWAQINYPYGASLEDARNKLSYDLYYVKNHGLFLDILIVLQTIRVILFADGSR